MFSSFHLCWCLDGRHHPLLPARKEAKLVAFIWCFSSQPQKHQTVWYNSVKNSVYTVLYPNYITPYFTSSFAVNLPFNYNYIHKLCLLTCPALCPLFILLSIFLFWRRASNLVVEQNPKCFYSHVFARIIISYYIKKNSVTA